MGMDSKSAFVFLYHDFRMFLAEELGIIEIVMRKQT
jgi:hypothetical protein